MLGRARCPSFVIASALHVDHRARRRVGHRSRLEAIKGNPVDATFLALERQVGFGDRVTDAALFAHLVGSVLSRFLLQGGTRWATCFAIPPSGRPNTVGSVAAKRRTPPKGCTRSLTPLRGPWTTRALRFG